jgi:bacterioferritin-associated ferredoxin
VLVCHCAAVSDRSVRDAIESGARLEEEIAARCGAASRCGGCLPEVRRLLDEHGQPLETVAAATAAA